MLESFNIDYPEKFPHYSFCHSGEDGEGDEFQLGKAS